LLKVEEFLEKSPFPIYSNSKEKYLQPTGFGNSGDSRVVVGGEM
jgi:hypothetical protein